MLRIEAWFEHHKWLISSPCVVVFMSQVLPDLLQEMNPTFNFIINPPNHETPTILCNTSLQ